VLCAVKSSLARDGSGTIEIPLERATKFMITLFSIKNEIYGGKGLKNATNTKHCPDTPTTERPTPSGSVEESITLIQSTEPFEARLEDEESLDGGKDLTKIGRSY